MFYRFRSLHLFWRLLWLFWIFFSRYLVVFILLLSTFDSQNLCGWFRTNIKFKTFSPLNMTLIAFLQVAPILLCILHLCQKFISSRNGYSKFFHHDFKEVIINILCFEGIPSQMFQKCWGCSNMISTKLNFNYIKFYLPA